MCTERSFHHSGLYLISPEAGGISFLLQSVKNFIHGPLYLYTFATKCNIQRDRKCGNNAFPWIMFSVISQLTYTTYPPANCSLPDSISASLHSPGLTSLCSPSFFLPSFPQLPSFYLSSAQYSQDRSNRVQLKYPFSMKPLPPSPQDRSSTFSSELVWHFSVVPLMQASLFDSLTFLCISHSLCLKNGL